MFIDKRIAQLGLTQQAAADRMGISQSDVSKMLRGRFENFSLERLLRLVRLLGSDVEIKVTTRRRQRRWRASPLANDAEGHNAEGQHEGRMSLMMA